MTYSNEFYRQITAARDGIRDAFKVALDEEDFPQNTLSELWRHFLGVQSISEQVKSNLDPLNSFTEVNLNYGLNQSHHDENPWGHTVSSVSDDIITFGDA